MKAADAYGGDKDWLLKTFPGTDFGPDAHEHFHHDGCFYWREHLGGRETHTHRYDCGNEIHGQGGRRTASCRRKSPTLTSTGRRTRQHEREDHRGNAGR